MSKKPRTAFVLAGGGSLGAVQAGMLRALYERGVSADLVVGTSAGAINGAFIASRPQTVSTAAELGELWRGVTRGQVFPLNPLTGLLGFLGNRDHLVPGSGLERLVSRHLDRTRLEHMPLPLHVVAVDVVTGEELRLSRGPTLEAVLASAAIPAVLPPVAWEDRELIDGGVANNTPISHAVELGAEIVYVLPTGHACALEEPPRGALAISPIDFGQAGELIERAHADACEFLDSGGADRPAIRMRMHRHAPSRGKAASALRALPGAPRPAPAAAPQRRAT